MKRSVLMKKLGAFVRVSNLTSPNGNDVPNQFNIVFENGVVFQSYESLIAVRFEGKTYIGQDYDYSRTTSKYLNTFCGFTSKEITKKLENKDERFVLIKE